MNHSGKLVALFVLLNIGAAAQNVAFDKRNFGDQDGFKAATAALKKGEDAFQQGPQAYPEAIAYYLKANAFNPNNAELNFKLGACYINSTQRTEALPYVQKALDLDPNVHPRVHYLLGMALHLNAEWDNAIKQYRLHEKSAQGGFDAADLFTDIPKLIAECQNGKRLMADPVDVVISNLGKGLNSEYSEQGPVINADGSRLMYTSKRPGTTGGSREKSTGAYFEDIYLSKRSNRAWSDAVNVGEPINSNINDAAVGLSNDGSRLIIYRGDKKSGDLYEARRVGEKWSEPERLNKHINSAFHEPSASYSFDNKWLYFVSDRTEGAYGGMDIFRSQWDEDKRDWGSAENLGPEINSPYDEEGIFVHPDGKTIYFSSKGHESMGGYDVFSSQWNGIAWSKPKNLGYPLNTPDDDLYYVCSASGRTGYFSSVRPGGFGQDDIYHVHFRTERKPMLNAHFDLLAGLSTSASDPMIEPRIEMDDSDLALLHGWIKNLKELAGMEAYIEVMDLEDGSLVARFLSDPETGEYLVSLPAGKDYGINIRADGFLFHSENVNIPTGSGYMEFEKDIALKEIEVGNNVVLRNIFFDMDQYRVKRRSQSELDNLATLLKENPTIVLEISGHTDNTGGEAHNQQLSEERANAVVLYLTQLGVAAERLVAKGYGPSTPIASNDTEEGRALNRRTEFKVIAK